MGKPPLANFGSGLFRSAIMFLAGAYLLLILLDALVPKTVYARVPGPILYFAQISALFPYAKTIDTDFRAEVWVCRDGLFREIDTRPFFRIQADNKENRFSRVMYFYRNSPLVLSGLGRYIAGRANADAKSAPEDSADGYIGGVRLSVVYDTIPPPTGKPVRYLRKPLDAYPPDARKVWYEPSAKHLWRACRERVP